MIWLEVISEESATIPAWVVATDEHLTLVKIGYVEPESLLVELRCFNDT